MNVARTVDGLIMIFFTRYTYVMEEPKSQLNMSRRGFLGGLAALVTTPSSADVIRPRLREDAVKFEEEEKLREQEVIESLPKTFTTFEERVAFFLPHYTTELPHMLKFGGLQTNGDPEQRTRLEYLREALVLPHFPGVVREKIRHVLPAKAFVESGLDANRVSSDDAKGVLQFTKGTWQEHAPSAEADILSLIDQVVATDNLLEQIRRTFENQCNEALGVIKEVFFAGDEDSFQADFLTFAILGSFNCGATTMSTLIQKFADRYPNTHAVAELLQAGIYPSRKDVFALMTYLGKEMRWNEFYGKESYEYVFRIGAARSVLDALPEEERLVFLGEADVG